MAPTASAKAAAALARTTAESQFGIEYKSGIRYLTSLFFSANLKS
jgi:hypothetical protein